MFAVDVLQPVCKALSISRRHRRVRHSRETTFEKIFTKTKNELCMEAAVWYQNSNDIILANHILRSD